MKKWITLFLALAMALSLAACGGQSASIPSTNDGSSLSGEKLTNDDTSSENGGMPAAGAATTNTCTPSMPSPYAFYKDFSKYTEFTYDYLGLSYKISSEIKDKLTSGEMSAFVDTNWMSNGMDFNYFMIYFNVAEKENLTMDILTSDTENAYFEWLSTTKRVGTITVINSEYLKENTVESITECEKNEEIGKSSDGRYVFYFSTNQVDGETELFKTIEVTTFDPKPVPDTGVMFSFFDGDHK